MAKAIGRLARVARRQHGLWTRAQSIAAGVSGRETRQRLHTGDWLEIRCDVFCAASRPVDEIGAILAVCLEIGPPVAASGVAAAFVRRYPLVLAPALVTVVVPDHRRVATNECGVARSRCFPKVVPRVDGVPVLSRVDTLITLAEQVPHSVLLDCLQELTRQRDVRLEDVWQALTRGRSGSAALRRAVTELSAGGDSRPERQLHRALRTSGVRGFEFGWELLLRDGTRYWPDLWNDALGFCIEVDGVATHSRPSRMEGDRVRDNRMALLGIAIARFTAGRVGRAIEAVSAEVEAAVEVRRRSPLTLREYTARRRPGRAA